MWSYWVSVWVTNAALAVGVVGYLTTVLPALGSMPPVVVAVGLIWLFVFVNLLGVRTGGGVQIVTTALKLIPMAVIIGLGLWTLLVDPSAYTQNLPTTPVTMPSILAASAIVLYAMLGIESAAVPAGQVRDPERTIPRATIAGTLITALVYVGVTVIALFIVPQATLASSSAPFVEVLDRLAGVGGGRWLAFFVVISGLGCLNGWTMLVGDMTRSFAARGFLPRSMARCNRFGAPAVALVATAMFASALALMNYSKSLVDGFTFLTIVITAAATVIRAVHARGALPILVGGTGCGRTPVVGQSELDGSVRGDRGGGEDRPPLEFDAFRRDLTAESHLDIAQSGGGQLHLGRLQEDPRQPHAQAPLNGVLGAAGQHARATSHDGAIVERHDDAVVLDPGVGGSPARHNRRAGPLRGLEQTPIEGEPVDDDGLGLGRRVLD
jgi:APA family basic amino acid/polyamine antiporter